MESSITLKDKKDFIKYFLSHYQPKKRESVWILNYLLNHDEILNYTHFVREAKFCPRAMIISTHCTDQVAFRFYKKHIVTTDADKSFHDIRLNRKDPIYIQLNFKNSKYSIPYAVVLEDNPYLPEDYFLTSGDKENISELLSFSVYKFQKDKIEAAINNALDSKNETDFIFYTNALKDLEESNKKLK
ncbi:ReoY family proteolytic degradation factor [Saliterribacillus persicus]|uniref:UPF0302 protein DFR57_112100 n=1 Tax=Saliterribacillus persicus TaxID=930114 RepID=A0A368XAD5_9BACI|nr:ReoY family proteolytic degradation factor [Saliterribacillus persicus]RCW64922.1 uncharacterized protein YpiB (UPF0302 family) [Saliterribacillus persicus]